MQRASVFLLLSTVLLAGGLPLSAGELILALEFPADYAPAPRSFLVTYLSSNTQTETHQFRIPNLGRASCDGVQSLPDLVPDSVCGRPPDCLPPGIYTFWVQAEWEGVTSDQSNILNCEARPGCVYDCTGVAIPPSLQALIKATPGGGDPTVDPEEGQRVVTALAQADAPVVQVTTPPPTIADIIDRVQPALQALPKIPV
jgi:hypothetical protein